MEARLRVSEVFGAASLPSGADGPYDDRDGGVHLLIESPGGDEVTFVPLSGLGTVTVRDVSNTGLGVAAGLYLDNMAPGEWPADGWELGP